MKNRLGTNSENVSEGTDDVSSGQKVKNIQIKSIASLTSDQSDQMFSLYDSVQGASILGDREARAPQYFTKGVMHQSGPSNN